MNKHDCHICHAIGGCLSIVLGVRTAAAITIEMQTMIPSISMPGSGRAGRDGLRFAVEQVGRRWPVMTIDDG